MKIIRRRCRTAKMLDRLLLFLLLAGIAVFILYPLVSLIGRSVFKNGMFTLEYYRLLFTRASLKLLKNSLWVASVSSVLTMTGAFFIALHLYTSSPKRRKRMENCLLLTMISPPFVSALAFIMLFGRRGLITYGLLHISANPYGWQGIVILQVIGNLSFTALFLLTFFDGIDGRLIMASRDLGADSFHTLRLVILPAVRPGMLSVLFTLFTMNLADFGTPVVIGGKYKVLATEAYLQAISSADLGKASAISVLLLLPAVAAFWLYGRALSSAGTFSGAGKMQTEWNGDYRLPPVLAYLAAGCSAAFFVVMALKYGNTFLNTVSNTSTGHIQFTLKYFRDLPRSQMSSFCHSLVCALAAGLLSSFVGILLAYYTRRRKIRGMAAAEFAASLPYIIPGTFFGLGYVAAFSHPPFLLRGTMWIILLNCAFRQISVGCKAANGAFAAIDEKTEMAARDMGATALEILFGIVFPQLKQVFKICFVTVFTSAMTATGAIVFLISPGKNVASVELFQSVENGRYGVASVQAVMILLVTAAVNIASMYLFSGKEKKRNVSGTDRCTKDV